MALYPIIHKETGETRELEMSVHKIIQWYKDNPEWERNWAEGCATPCEAGEWKDRLIKNHPDWNEVLKKANKAGASQSKIGKI